VSRITASGFRVGQERLRDVMKIGQAVPLSMSGVWERQISAHSRPFTVRRPLYQEGGLASHQQYSYRMIHVGFSRVLGNATRCTREDIPFRTRK
jgi:hypothetical protein